MYHGIYAAGKKTVQLKYLTRGKFMCDFYQNGMSIFIPSCFLLLHSCFSLYFLLSVLIIFLLTIFKYEYHIMTICVSWLAMVIFICSDLLLFTPCLVYWSNNTVMIYYYLTIDWKGELFILKPTDTLSIYYTVCILWMHTTYERVCAKAIFFSPFNGR